MASRFSSAIKDAVSINRNKRNASSSSVKAKQQSIDTSNTSSSLTVFEIKKEITSKQLQHEEICALTVCKNLIYLATKSGHLSIFEERMNQQTARRSSSNLKSHIKHKTTAEYKKAKNIKQMAVCLDKNIMILVLTNGHYLCMDALNLVEYTDKKKNSLVPLNKTKNAERIITAFKRPYYRFALVSKKNVYLFEWNKSNKNYSFVREMSNGEPCVSCLFYNNFICVSSQKKGFIMYDIKTALEVKISVPSIADNVPNMYQISHHDDDYKEVSKIPNDGHLLVQVSPNLMLFIDKTGNPAQKDTVNWSSTPLFVIDCKQYMVGYLDTKVIEIISLVDQKAVQMLKISGYDDNYDIQDRNIDGLYRTSSDHIIMYDRFDVFSVLPTPIHQQISECIKHLRIEKGLKLLMNDGVGPTQNELRAFQAEAGFALLCNLQWKRAMEHLEISDVDPRDVIYLFPEIKFNAFEYIIQHSSAPKHTNIYDIIDEGLTERRHKMNITTNDENEKKNEYLHGIYYLGHFLWKRRSDPSSDDLAIIGAELKLCVDTALLKIYVELIDNKYNSSTHQKATPFEIKDLLDYEEENACVESECEKILISSEQYFDLALFYRSKKKLDKALLSLYKIGYTKEWFGDVDDAMDLTINILCLMKDKQDLWTYARWVLMSKPLDAMNIFTHSKRRRTTEHPLYIDFDRVIQYLNEDIISGMDDYSDILWFDYNEYYLEFIVSQESIDLMMRKYHDDLAYLYMKKIQKLIKLGKHNNALDKTRDKLLKFLEKSQLISPSKLLQHAKKFQLYDEIIELNKKLKNHKAVLYTLVCDKNEHAQAIKYCMETAPCSKDRSDRFLELLRLYFGENTHTNDDDKDELNSKSDDSDDNAHVHHRNQTINIELLQQELNADDDAFAFMDTADGQGGMNFDFDDDELNININNMNDMDMDEMKDEITELPSDSGVFQVPTRARGRHGAISVVEKRDEDSEDRDSMGEDKDTELYFDKGCEILCKYTFEMDYLEVLSVLPSDKNVMYFSKYIKKLIPFIVHKRRITQIKKNLHKRQYLRECINLATIKSVAIKMDYNSKCVKCDKNIGSSVFILDPNNHKKYHYSCYYKKRAPQNQNVITNQHMVRESETETEIDDTNPFGQNTDDNNNNNTSPFAQTTQQTNTFVDTNPFQKTDNTNPFQNNKDKPQIFTTNHDNNNNNTNLFQTTNPFS